MQDLLLHYQQLFHVCDEELERERRLLAEQRKLQDIVSVDKVSHLLAELSPRCLHETATLEVYGTLQMRHPGKT